MAQLGRCMGLSGAPAVAAAPGACGSRLRTVFRVTCQAPSLRRAVPVSRGVLPWQVAGVAAVAPLLAAPALAEEEEAVLPPPSAIAEVELPALEVPVGGGSLEAAIEVPAEVSVPALEIELATVDEGTFLLLAGAALAALLIGLASVALSRGYAGDVPPEAALSAVESGSAIFLDVRSTKEKREDGSPRVKAATRGQTTLVAVPFLRSLGGDEFEVDEGFVDAVKGSKAMDLNGNLIVVDSSGAKEIGVAAAKALTAAGVNNVAVLKGGSDAWKEQGLPWNDPLLSLPSLNEASITKGLQNAASTLSEVAEETQKALPGALTVLAAAGATVAFVAEAEVILQLAASLAAGQFFVSRLLFAKDREQTLAQLKALIGPAGEDQAAEKEAPSDSPTKEAAAASNGAVATAESTTTEAPPPVPAAAATALAEAPQAPAEAPPAPATATTDLPPASRPLSPYSMYPDLKPPSSPTPLPPVPPSAASATAPPPSTDLPKSGRPLSPYSAYPDLKPPSSPTPLPPSPQQEPAAAVPSAESPSTPLSPYAVYPDMKPPSPPATPVAPNPSP